MDPYPLRQLAAICSAQPVAPKVLFAPGVRAGYDLTTALARAGVAWTNLRVTTPALHAAEVAEPVRAACGARRADADVRRLLVEAVLAEQPAAQRGGIRGPTAGSGLGPTLCRTFEDLRLAGVAASQLLQAGLPADRAADLALLFDGYCRRLAAEGWWDDAETFRRAAERAPAGARSRVRVWIVLDETDLPSAAHRYLLSVTGGDVVRIGRREYGVPAPAHSAAVRFARAPLPGVPALAPGRSTPPAGPAATRGGPARVPEGRLAQGDLFLDPLRAGTDAAPANLYPTAPRSRAVAGDVDPAPGGRLLTVGLRPDDAGAVRLWETVGTETEVRAVVRDILGRGLRFDDVEIAYTAAPYAALLFDAAERWDLPLDLAHGAPSRLMAPGRAVAALLAWVAGGLDGAELAGHLRAGDLGWDETDPSPATVAGWLLAGRVGRGPEAAGQALDRREAAAARAGRRRDGEEAPTAGDGGVERRRLRFAAARTHLADLHACVPSAEQDCALADVARGAVRFLQRWTGAERGGERSERDRRVREDLVVRLEGIAVGPASSGPRATQARRVLDLALTFVCEGRRAAPGRLLAAPLHGAGYSGRPHLYVLGLDESHFPGTAAHDPVLLDAERRALSPELPARATAPTVAAFHLVRILGTAAGTATLVANRLRLADGREPYPSALFAQARRQLGVEPDRIGPTPVPAQVAAGAGVDDLEGFLALRAAPAYAAAAAAAYPAAARGARAQLARMQPAPTRFDGWLRSEETESLHREAGRVLSSQMLETMAQCPRRYLLRYVLGLRPPEEPPRDPRRWLQPPEMGELLHGLFLDFMAALAQRGERPTAGHEAELGRLAAVAIARAQEEVPVALEAAARSDRRRIERAARIFLAAEAQRLAADPALVPAVFELEFGARDVDAIEVRLSSQVAFRLRGRIDRVDRVAAGPGAGQREIWDYKTGSPHAFREGDLLHGGRTLQWALYAAALRLLPQGGPVRRSGYFFTSDRGSGQRFAAAPPPDERLAAALLPLFQLAVRGFFPAVHKGEARGGGPCRFCDFRRVCAAEALGEQAVDAVVEEAEQLGALVEGWAETVASRRSASRRAVEAQLRRRGLEPEDVAPAETVAALAAWMRT